MLKMLWEIQAQKHSPQSNMLFESLERQQLLKRSKKLGNNGPCSLNECPHHRRGGGIMRYSGVTEDKSYEQMESLPIRPWLCKAVPPIMQPLT